MPQEQIAQPSDAAAHADIHFGCIGCGACCDQPPDVRMVEALSVADAFIMQLEYARATLPRAGREEAVRIRGGFGTEGLTVYRPHDPQMIATSMRDHFRAQGDVVVTTRPNDDIEHHIFTIARPLNLTLQARCPALGEDGLCGVYERRPAMCRTVPLGWTVPDALAAAYLGAFTKRPGYKCDTSPNAPVMFRDGELVSLEYRAERDRAAALSGAEAHRLAVLLVRGGSEGWPLIPTLPEILEQTSTRLLLPLSVSFMPMVAAGIATETSIVRAAGQQLELMRSEREKNAGARDRLAIAATPTKEYLLRNGIEALLDDLSRATERFARPGFMHQWRQRDLTKKRVVNYADASARRR
ncbi:MAG: YkgJ family cysteine cluster protein [Gemmatimonadota bacterium]|nr:YkgJ family cysteine cluster protein [Gemmatimonadota bacterium]